MIVTGWLEINCLQLCGARAGTRTRVQALATLGDNHYTTLASVTLGLDRGINRCRLEKGLVQASPNPPSPPSLSDPRITYTVAPAIARISSPPIAT